MKECDPNNLSVFGCSKSHTTWHYIIASNNWLEVAVEGYFNSQSDKLRAGDILWVTSVSPEDGSIATHCTGIRSVSAERAEVVLSVDL